MKTRKFLGTIGFCLIVFLTASNFAFGKESQPSTSDSQNLIEQGYSTNKAGKAVKSSPAHTKKDDAPLGATALCNDGTYSFSQHRRGTCSHHHGVKSWL